MPLRARVEKLAPTGEGVVRTIQGVGLVDGVLPGEDVEVDLDTVRVTKKIWRGRPAAVAGRSPARASGPHAEGCPACDWAHVELAAARAFKRELFLETMGRIGRIPPDAFGALEVEPSPVGYRLRSRLHAEPSGEGVGVSLGGFAPRTHRVESLERCEALSPEFRSALPRIADALADAGLGCPAELSTVESLDGARRLARIALAGEPASGGAAAWAIRAVTALAPLFAGVAVADRAGRTIHRTGEERLWLPVGPDGRDVPAEPGAFFQANRFLTSPLAAHVRDLASATPAGTALDAFGGSGLFAASLLAAGHSVTSVEGSPESVRAARLARERWGAPDHPRGAAGGRRSGWRIESAAVLDFASRDDTREDVVVADPPRAGLGAALAQALAARTRRSFLYVSCDPATLARDLAILVAAGFEIRSARLFDLFALTHRVEAVVSLERVRGA